MRARPDRRSRSGWRGRLRFAWLGRWLWRCRPRPCPFRRPSMAGGIGVPPTRDFIQTRSVPLKHEKGGANPPNAPKRPDRPAKWRSVGPITPTTRQSATATERFGAMWGLPTPSPTPSPAQCGADHPRGPARGPISAASGPRATRAEAWRQPTAHPGQPKPSGRARTAPRTPRSGPKNQPSNRPRSRTGRRRTPSAPRQSAASTELAGGETPSWPSAGAGAAAGRPSL